MLIKNILTGQIDLEELSRRVEFDDFPKVEDDDAIGVDDGVESVRHRDHRRRFEFATDYSLD